MRRPFSEGGVWNQGTAPYTCGSGGVSHTHLLLHAVHREDYKYYPRHREREDEEALHSQVMGLVPHFVNRHLKGPDRSRNAIRTSDTCQCPCVVTQVVVVERDREGCQSSRELSISRENMQNAETQFMTYHDRKEREVRGIPVIGFLVYLHDESLHIPKSTFPNTWELLYQGKYTLRPFNRDLCPVAAH